MPLLSDPAGVTPEDYHLNDTDAGPFPQPPAFARVLPISVVEQAKQQQQAEEWGQQQQKKIADLWGSFAQDRLDQTVQQFTQGPDWQPAQPTAYEPVTDPMSGASMQPDAQAQPSADDPIGRFMSGLGGLVDRMKGTPEEAANPVAGTPFDASKVLPTLESVAAPAGEAIDKLTGGKFGEAMGQVGNIDVAHGLGALAQTQAPLTNEDVASLPKVTAGDVASEGASLVQPGPGHAPLGVGATPAAQAMSDAARLGGHEAPAIAGAGDVVARADLTADHPIVQAVVDASQQAGAKVNADAVGRLLQSKGFDPENLAKATGRLNPTQAAALAAYKASQDPEVASAVMKSADEALFAPSAAKAGAEVPPTATDPTLENLGKAGTVAPEDVTDLPPYTGAGESKLAENPAIRGLNAVQGVLKQAVLAGSVFHPIVESAQLGRTALAEMAPVAGAKGIAASVRAFADSAFAQRFAAQHADDIALAEKSGMTMARIGNDVSPDVQQMGNNIARAVLSSTGSGVAGYASAKAQGQSDEDALKRGAIFAAGGAGIAKLAPNLNAAMWGRMIPVAKLTAFNIMKDNYGPEVAAKRANDIFGGQNLAKLGRNPELQTVLKSTFLAPDWLESWARNLGAVVKPGPEGDAARKWWAATGVSSALALEGMNMAINGHMTTDNEPGRQLSLEVTPIVRAMGGDPKQRYYADVLELGPLGSVLQADARGGIGAVGANLAVGHLNVAPDIGLSAVKNLAPTGGQIVSQGTPAEQAALPEIAAAAGHVAPIGASTFEKGDVPVPAAAGSALTGIRIAAGPAGVKKAPAANPMAPQGAAAAPKNVSNLRSFLTGPKAKTANPMAPRATANSNVSKLGALK